MYIIQLWKIVLVKKNGEIKMNNELNSIGIGKYEFKMENKEETLEWLLYSVKKDKIV